MVYKKKSCINIMTLYTNFRAIKKIKKKTFRIIKDVIFLQRKNGNERERKYRY